MQAALQECEAVVIGAGSGLSTAAGYTYTGERFQKYFADFAEKYGIRDMYSGGFYPFPTQEEFWGYWSRYIFINRYMDAPKPVYEKLLRLVADKDYFVITTNVDHCFRKLALLKSGFSICREIMACFSAVSHAAGKRMIMKSAFGKCWKSRRICEFLLS